MVRLLVGLITHLNIVSPGYLPDYQRGVANIVSVTEILRRDRALICSLFRFKRSITFFNDLGSHRRVLVASIQRVND